MKNIKWKTLITTSAVCLIPILLGIALWDALPDKIAIHFNFKGEPDNYASKAFAVFGIPLLMVLFQVICCVASDVGAKKQSDNNKFELITKWIIPCITVALYVITLGFSLGWNIDMRKAVGLICGIILIVVGNYMPKFDRVKNMRLDKEKAKKVNRFTGYLTVIMGILSVITMFLPAISLIIWLFMWIPFTLVTVIYVVNTARK